MENVFYVNNFFGNSDDEKIDACLAAAKAVEKRTIVFDKKDYYISKAIELPSNTEVIIDNCMIKQQDEVFDNIFRGDNITFDPNDPHAYPTEITELKNIKITGIGTAVLEGPDVNKKGRHPYFAGNEGNWSFQKEIQEMTGDYWGYKTHHIDIACCDGFEVAGLTIKKTSGWAVNFTLCCNGYVHDLYFDVDVKNGDGVNFRSGCHDCVIERIKGLTTDDSVAINATSKGIKKYPNGRVMYPGDLAIPLKTTKETRDIYNIKVRDIETCGRHHGVIVLASNGCQVHDIEIDGFTETYRTDEEMEGRVWGLKRESTIKIYTGYGTDYNPGDIHDVTVKNVKAKYADAAVYCNCQVKNVVLENITHEGDGEVCKLDYPDGITIK